MKVDFFHVYELPDISQAIPNGIYMVARANDDRPKEYIEIYIAKNDLSGWKVMAGFDDLIQAVNAMQWVTEDW